MGTSFLASLITQLFKNIAYVESFGHVLFNLMFKVNSNLTGSSASCSASHLEHLPTSEIEQEMQCHKNMKIYPLGSIDSVFKKLKY